MPWFPEFGLAWQMAAEGRAQKLTADVVRTYTDSVHSGIPSSASDGIVVHDPGAGRIAGVAAFREFLASSARWLEETEARTEWLASTATPGRAVVELVTHLRVEGRAIGLPIAGVAEQRPDHVEFRVYYSQWPLLGKHTLRPPILRNTGAEPLGWPAEYHAALTAGDAEAIAEAFEPGGYFREPSGADFTHAGQDLYPFFKMFFSAGGGIHLEHCVITDDGIRCALEYNCVRWGNVDIPPQAGIGVYERGPSGKLKAARVYDDVEPPKFH